MYIFHILQKYLSCFVINCKCKSSLVLVKVRGVFRTCQLDMVERFIAKIIHSLTIYAKTFHDTLQKITKFHQISWCRNFVERHSLCRNFCGNCAFAQYFHIMKLGEISVFYAVIDAWHGSKYAFEDDVISTVRTLISQRRDVA